MKKFSKFLIGGIAVIGILLIIASIWASHQISDMPDQTEPSPVESKSAYAQVTEACEKEVGREGTVAVRRCEAEIIGSQIDEYLDERKSSEDDAIARARERLN